MLSRVALYTAVTAKNVATMPMAPKALAAALSGKKWMSTKIIKSDEHSIYHGTYPTPDEVHQVVEERKKMKEKMKRAAEQDVLNTDLDEHSVFYHPSPPPTNQEQEERKKMKEKMKRAAEQDVLNTDLDEHSAFYHPSPPPTNQEQMKKILEHKRLKAKMEHDAEHFTYPVSYPTEGEVEYQKEHRKMLKKQAQEQLVADMGEVPPDEHSVYYTSTPKPHPVTREEMEKIQKEKKAKEEKDAEIRHHAWE